MIVDSSALIAILSDEPGSDALLRRLSAAQVRAIGSATLVEASMVALSRRGEKGLDRLRAFVAENAIEVLAIEPEHVDLAVDAFRRFGKGRHKASLNFGDCLSYAVARATNEPLLFRGDDFALTDVDVA